MSSAGAMIAGGLLAFLVLALAAPFSRLMVTIRRASGLAPD